MRYNLTPVRMAMVKKMRDNKCCSCGGCGEMGTLVLCWQERRMVPRLWNNIEVPQKIKIELPYDPVIPLLTIYLKEMKSVS